MTTTEKSPQKLHLGYIGLGKMGSNMVERLCETGHTVSAYDPIESARVRLDNVPNATAYDSYKAMVDSLPKNSQNIVWVMVPSKVNSQVINKVADLLGPDDLMIDGGNTNFNQTLEHAKLLSDKDIKFMDVGVSGGPTGARSGACMMVGGDKENFDKLEQLFIDLCVPDGYGYMGQAGAGHFVKMVHNGIEYGMMQAIGEGFALLHDSQYDLDLTKVAHVYGHGSVISSSLIDWLYRGYQTYGQDLEQVSGEVAHSGEGQWTVEYAKEVDVFVDNIAQSLQFRIDSAGNPSYTGKVVSTLRNQFGGHEVSVDRNEI